MRNLALALLAVVFLMGCGNAALEKAKAVHAHETAKLEELRAQYKTLMVPYDDLSHQMGEARVRNDEAAILAANEKLAALNKARNELEEMIRAQEALVEAAAVKAREAE